MITSIAFAISTSAVSAAHEPTVEITPAITKVGDMDFDIKVTNTGGSPIIKVEVTQPTAFTLGDWVGTLVAENTVITVDEIPNTKIPAGTGIPLLANQTLTLVENTLVTIPAGAAGENLISITVPFPVILPAGTIIGVGGLLQEDTEVELKYDTRVTSTTTISLTKPEVTLDDIDMVILPAGIEITLPATTTMTNLPPGKTSAPVEANILGETTEGATVTAAALVAKTVGKVGPEDITVELTAATTCPLATDATGVALPSGPENLLAGTKLGVVLALDITHEMHFADISATLYEDTTAKLNTIRSISLTTGVDNVRLPPDNVIVATLASSPSVSLAIGTEVVLPKDTSVPLVDADLTLPIPEDWKVVGYTTGSDVITWENATTDGKIGLGASLTFSFTTTTATEAEHLWTIRTTAVDGSVAYRTLTTTVDDTPPELTVTMEPETVGAGPATIKVEASEELSKLENVYYQIDENEDHIGDPVNLIAMESADGITWTGTLMVPKDGLWDGSRVDIEILAAGYEDPAGNEGSEVSKTIHSIDAPHINTIPPLLPEDLKMTETTPFDNQVNQKSQLIIGIAMDNLAGTPTAEEGLTVKISVNDTVYETESLALGAFAKEIDLNEGPNTIKVWVVDELGNVGPENEQAVFLDTIKPTISMVSVADKAYEDNVPVKDSTPTVVLTIKDPGYPAAALGVETFTVKLENADDFSIELENAIPWDKATGRFENTISEKLDEGFYYILVEATDLVGNTHSATFWFEVDVTAPLMPEPLTSANNPILYGTTVAEPKVQKEIKLVIYGSGLEKSCAVKVYLVDQATGGAISMETTTADATGGFSESLTLVGGKTIRIEMETIDAAGNVSSRPVYGYVMADATAPTVTLGTLPGTTDKTSVILSGTVDKDDWEDWSDITLAVQIGIGSVEVQIGAEGGYSCSVPLSMGVNTIAVRATDSVGNASLPATATVERVVTMDTSAPGVTLEALPEATDKVSITIGGTVTKDDWESWSDITLTVQVGTGKVEVPIGAGGTYSYSIELAEGPNMIVVQATDAVGNAGAAESDMVERTVTAWGIYAIVLVIIALVMAAIAIFKGSRIWKR